MCTVMICWRKRLHQLNVELSALVATLENDNVETSWLFLILTLALKSRREAVLFTMKRDMQVHHLQRNIVQRLKES